MIRRRGFLDVLKRQLLHPDGSRIYDDPDDHRVLYSSTLVDVAATMELLRETAAACTLIFEHTEWQIRLLSKNPLLKLLVTKDLIPRKYHTRLILGFSTGTLDDGLAAAIERGTGKVSQRIKALHLARWRPVVDSLKAGLSIRQIYAKHGACAETVHHVRRFMMERGWTPPKRERPKKAKPEPKPRKPRMTGADLIRKYLEQLLFPV